MKSAIQTWFDIPEGYSRRFVLENQGVRHELSFSNGELTYRQEHANKDPEPVLSWVDQAIKAVAEELFHGPPNPRRKILVPDPASALASVPR